MKARLLLALLVALALGIALLRAAGQPTQGGTPAVLATSAQSPVAPRYAPVDLSVYYDKDPSFDAPGCWQAVPRGLQTIGSIPFSIAGLIQLWGQGPAGIGRNYRESVEGIPLVTEFQTLYVLHGASFIAPTGTEIAQVVLRYTDGASVTNRIHYGTDSRDWWEPLVEQEPFLTNGPSQVVWRGDHLSLPDWVKGLRLFATGIPNPKPASEVKSVDLYSTKSQTTWFVLAMTAGPLGALKQDLPADSPADLAAESVTLKLSVLNKDTAQPIPNARLRVTLQSGRRPKPYGVFHCDDAGVATITLPPVQIKLVSIESEATDYLPEQATWNLAKGEKLPDAYVFRLSK